MGPRGGRKSPAVIRRHSSVCLCVCPGAKKRCKLWGPSMLFRGCSRSAKCASPALSGYGLAPLPTACAVISVKDARRAGRGSGEKEENTYSDNNGKVAGPRGKRGERRCAPHTMVPSCLTMPESSRCCPVFPISASPSGIRSKPPIPSPMGIPPICMPPMPCWPLAAACWACW